MGYCYHALSQQLLFPYFLELPKMGQWFVLDETKPFSLRKGIKTFLDIA
jgi:hypothetical protein